MNSISFALPRQGSPRLGKQNSTEADMSKQQPPSSPRVTARSVQVDGHTIEVALELPENSTAEPMFAKLYLWLLESGKLAAMTAKACKVYCAILCRADFSSLECYPSINRIASDSGLSKSAVQNALVELVGLGLILKSSGKAHSGNTTNRYLIAKPPIPCGGIAIPPQGQAIPSGGPPLYRTAEAPIPPQGNELKTENKRQLTRQSSKKLLKPLSEEASPVEAGETTEQTESAECIKQAEWLRGRLIRGGVKKQTALALLEECPAASIAAAIENADELKREGILANWAGYVVRSCFGANREETTVQPTRLTTARRTDRLAALERSESESAAIRAERRIERQKLAARRLGDVDRWREIDLSELD